MAYGKITKTENIVKIPNIWEVRDAERLSLLSDYIASYKNHAQLYRQAVAEKWDRYLIKYVSAVADIQAQAIAGVKNIGWDGVAIFPLGVNKNKAHAFLQEQYRIADSGMIDVAIPTGLITHWKEFSDFVNLRKS